MTGKIEEFVQRLPAEEIREIHANHTAFARDGYIGESALRTRAQQLMDEVGANGSDITIWMRELVTEIWRQHATPLLEDGASSIVVDREHLSKLVQLVRDAMECENEFMTEWDVEARTLLKELDLPDQSVKP